MFDSSNLIGAPVKDSHGEFVGFVNEVMVDSGGHALAVNHGDYDLLVQVYNTLYPSRNYGSPRTKAGQDTVVLKTDMEHLDFAPSLDPLKMKNRQYEANIYEYYGIQPYWTRSGTAGKSRFMELDSRDLVGAAVENSCGKVVGIVNEVMVDSGGHAFAIVNHGDYDLYGEGGVNTPVPFQELTISRQREARRLLFSRQTWNISISHHILIRSRWTVAGMRPVSTNITGFSPIGPKAVDYRSKKITNDF